MKETEEENEVLKQQIQQYKEKWSDYEAKMKSMEVMWQNQLTSLQVSPAFPLSLSLSPCACVLSSFRMCGSIYLFRHTYINCMYLCMYIFYW